ncbi:MAG: peptide chain release factor 1 [Thermoproteota archaeon]|nr:MAG: peptide chain release factor 1 [Candidatus Korarchaeota archaeon]RLG55142.1 MAG: peptide chain release factor 1 [Candidatus Korarchaeota archaeon]
MLAFKVHIEVPSRAVEGRGEMTRVSKLHLKRLLKELKSKRGWGTELISLYIPAGRNLHEVTRYLRFEYSQAANIKDKNTRKNVQAAIKSILQHLKLYRSTPENGLAIFCGAVSYGNVRGEEKIELIAIEPPEPITSFIYRCSSEFYLEPLEAQLEEKEVYAVIVMDRGGAAIAVIKGASYKIVDELNSDVPSKHRAGGQSQRRFERGREEAVKRYYVRLGEHANKMLLPIKELKHIIIAGPGDAKEEFANGDYLNYMLKQKVIGLVDTAYTGETGVREAIYKSRSLLSDARIYKEREAVQEVFERLSKDSRLVAYGIVPVEKALLVRAADRLVVLESLADEVLARCNSCGFFFKPDRSPRCPQCGGSDIAEAKGEEFLEKIEEEAAQTKATLVIVTDKTEWGEQLQKLGGIAAILRYAIE